MVLVSHTKGYPFGRLPDPGLSAIVAFFFLSGFLMPATIEANYADKTFFHQTVRYYGSRFLRIFPVYWFALLLQWSVLWLSPEARSNYDLSATAYLQNWLLLGLNQSQFWHSDQRFIGPAWTLDVELQYYAVAPFILLAARSLPRFTALLLLAVSAVSILYLAHPTGIDGVDRSLASWSVFFLGGFAAHWKRHWIRSNVPLRYISLFAAGLFSLSLVAAFHSAALSHWLLACALMATILRLIFGAAKPTRTDVFLGNLSYPVFLLHFVVQTSGLPHLIAYQIAPDSIAALALTTLALTLPLAAFAEIAIAAPIDKLRRHLRTTTSRRPSRGGVLSPPGP